MPEKLLKKVKPALSNPFPTLPPDHPSPGKFILIHGDPGEGKTTVAAHAPAPLFVSTSDEKGILEAVQAGVVPSEVKDNIVILPPLSDPHSIPAGGHPAWNLLMEVMDTFIEGNHDRRSLVIDTASGLQSICHQHCASVLFDSDMNDPKGFMNYQQGYLKAAEQFWNGEFLSRCNKITANGKNVFLICHSTTRYVPNLGGTEYECYAPSLVKGATKENIYEYTTKTVSAILYFGVHTLVSKTQSDKKRVASQHGFIGVREEGWFKAKNWYDLRDEIERGNSAKETWDNIVAVLPIS
jgi:hypothetical protein